MINFDKFFLSFLSNTPSFFTGIFRRSLGVKSATSMGDYLGCPMGIDGRSTKGLSCIPDKLLAKLTS